MRPEKITNRISFRLTVVFVVTLIFSCFTLGVVVYSSLTDVVKRNEADSMERRMAEYQFAWLNGGKSELTRLVDFQKTRTPDEKTGIILEDKSGILYRSTEDFGEFLPKTDAPGLHIELIDERGMDHDLKKFILDHRWTVLLKFFNFEVIYIQKKTIAPGLTLTFLQTFPNVEKDLVRVRMLGLSLLLVFVFMGLVLGYTLSRRVIHPIRKFMETIHQLEKGDGRARVEISEGNEFDHLAREFNQLMNSRDTLVQSMNTTLDTVAHEIRTPLTRFRIGAEVALSDSGKSYSYESVLRDGLVSAEQISFLLTNILDSSRANSGLIRLQREEVNLRDLLNELKDIYSFLLEEKQLKLEVVVPEDVIISADRRLLLQAVNNLLDNAIKFSPEGGKITLGASSSGDATEIFISDEGPGIDPSEQAKIWQRLYRSKKSTQPGYGIGLSVVQSVVDLHGGETSVESSGKGSTFRIKLFNS